MMLVCSGGGHLEQLLRLRPTWERWRRVWVSLDKPDVRARLAAERDAGQRVVFAHGPTNRSVGMLARNLALAVGVLRDERPSVVISNGAGVAPPFLWAATALGIPTVFVEVVDRVSRPSLAGRLVAPVVSRIVLASPSDHPAYRDAVELGRLW